MTSRPYQWSRRIEPLALLAACLALSAAYGLAIEADTLPMDQVRESPPFAGYRMVQEGVGAVVVLQFVTAVVAAIALIRIARGRERSGLSLALFSRFAAPYTFFCADILFLAPYHMDASYSATEMRFARAENAVYHWGAEWVRPILDRLREQSARNLLVISPSPATLGPPFVLRAWFDLEASDDSKAKPAVIELIPSASADAPAEVLFEGVRYEHAGAASAIVRARHDGEEYFRLQVDDGVPWRDVVHAMDALWPCTSLDS